jgi:hypothetical protein
LQTASSSDDRTVGISHREGRRVSYDYEPVGMTTKPTPEPRDDVLVEQARWEQEKQALIVRIAALTEAGKLVWAWARHGDTCEGFTGAWTEVAGSRTPGPTSTPEFIPERCNCGIRALGNLLSEHGIEREQLDRVEHMARSLLSPKSDTPTCPTCGGIVPASLGAWVRLGSGDRPQPCPDPFHTSADTPSEP